MPSCSLTLLAWLQSQTLTIGLTLQCTPCTVTSTKQSHEMTLNTFDTAGSDERCQTETGRACRHSE